MADSSEKWICENCGTTNFGYNKPCMVCNTRYSPPSKKKRPRRNIMIFLVIMTTILICALFLLSMRRGNGNTGRADYSATAVTKAPAIAVFTDEEPTSELKPEAPYLQPVGVYSGGKIAINCTKVPNAVRYEVEYSTNNIDYIRLTDITEAIAAIESPVSSGRVYFRVRACGDTVCGEYSNVRSIDLRSYTPTPIPTSVKTPVKTAAPNQQIGRPMISSVDINSDGKVRINWSAVTGADFYEIFYSKQNVPYTRINNTPMRYAVFDPPVSSGTIYFKVRACRKNSCGEFSFPKSLIIQKPAPTQTPISSASVSKLKLRTPKLLPVSLNSDGKISLNWTKVPNADRYKLEYSTDKETFILSENVLGTRTAIGPPVSYGRVYFRVRACSDTVCGDPSNVKSLIIQGPVPAQTPVSPSSASTLKLKIPKLLPAVMKSDGRIVLSWTKVPNAGRYELEYSTDNKSFTRLSDISATNITIDTPVGSGWLYFRVRACRDNTRGNFSFVSSLNLEKLASQQTAISSASVSTLKLRTPRLQPVWMNSDGKISVSWTRVPNAKRYELEYSIDKKTFILSEDVWGTHTTIDPPVSSGRVYFRVRACSDTVCGGPGNVKSLKYP